MITATKFKNGQWMLNRNVHKDNPFFILLMKCMYLDVNLLFPTTQMMVLHWAYDVSKSPLDNTSSYSVSKGRDYDAFKKADRIRVTLFDPKIEEYTQEFLAQIVQKIRFLKPMTTFSDFANFVRKTFYDYDIYESSLDDDGDSSISFCARIFCASLMMSRKIKIYDNQNVPIHTVVASNEENEVAILCTSSTFENGTMIEDHFADKDQIFCYNKPVLFVKTGTFFFLTFEYGTYSKNRMTGSYMLIPLNGDGDLAIRNGMPFKDLSVEMICGPTEIEFTKSIYLNVAFAKPGLGDIIFNLITFLSVMGITDNNYMLYIANDSDQKRDIIRLLSMNQMAPQSQANVDFEPVIPSLYGINLQEVQIKY